MSRFVDTPPTAVFFCVVCPAPLAFAVPRRPLDERDGPGKTTPIPTPAESDTTARATIGVPSYISRIGARAGARTRQGSGIDMDHDAKWSLDNAQANLPEVIESARGRPQTIMRDGEAAAILVSPEDWALLNVRSGSLADFLLRSPLRGSDLEIEPRDPAIRDLNL